MVALKPCKDVSIDRPMVERKAFDRQTSIKARTVRYNLEILAISSQVQSAPIHFSYLLQCRSEVKFSGLV